MAKTTRKKRKIYRDLTVLCCCVILIAVAVLITFTVYSVTAPKTTKPTDSEQPTENSSAVSSVPVKETFATVFNTGDIMVHSTQLKGAKTSDGYDFSSFFKEIDDYFATADLSVANLEVTFGGTESGSFSGYPAFNTPDQLADAIKASGLNFLLTSNNHSYDTRLFGLKRTAQVLRERGIEFIGTTDIEGQPLFTVKTVNDIKIGMADYTYETQAITQGRKYLNGNILAQEAEGLISTFSYERIEEFYTEAESVIASMKSQGAEFIVFYMHWGEEYQLEANTWQKNIAQRLCDLGVDMIIGGHPHVVQPIDLIHSQDGQRTTVCLYSAGNAVSNQRRELISRCSTGHTEDGLIFTYTLRKYGDDVTLTDVDVIPTWVNKYSGGSGYQYTIYPLETPDAGSVKYGLDSSTSEKTKQSYERTKAIVSEGLTKVQQALGCEVTFQ